MKKATNNPIVHPDFRLLFESAPALYLVLSPELRIIAASDAYLKATGKERGKIIGHDLFEVFPDNPKDPAATGVANLRASFEHVIEKKVADVMAVQKYDIHTNESGEGFEEKYWSPVNTPVFSRDKELAYIIHRVEDVTEFIVGKKKAGDQKRFSVKLKSPAEKMESEVMLRAHQLQQANKVLREAERIKSEFFANVSHELRTPLSLIIAPLESIMSGKYGEVNKAQAQLLHTIHNNTIRLLQMVIGLLDFSKFEAGKMKAAPESTDISALINSILKDFEPMVRGKKIDITCEINTPGIFLTIDRYLFERILFNLLANAVKFTPAGGRISVGVMVMNGNLTLEVRDTGIGIKDTDIPQIFQRFRQIEGSSTRRFEGTGLGLAMVKEFAELMGGTVLVTSRPGKGSTFTVELPTTEVGGVPEITHYKLPHASLSPQYQTESRNEEELEATIIEGAGHMPRVLICEDNEELTVYLVSLLRDFCIIKTARDGNEAMDLVNSWLPDLVLTDIMMPEKDGIEICREIKSEQKTSSIIVVLLTALTHREAMLKGWEARADEYLFKPFHPDELVTRIRSLLEMVAERKRTDEIMQQQNTLLNIAHSGLEYFTSSVSQQLQAPLLEMEDATRLLSKATGGKADKSMVDNVAVIKGSLALIEEFIHNLFTYSRMLKKELNKEMVDMNELVEEVISEMKLKDAKFNPLIKLEKLQPALCDPDVIKLAWTHLISNAAKFSKSRSIPVIRIGSKKIEGQSIYFIKDNGVGFDMRDAQKLFELFTKFHTPPVYKGTGVGLAIVHQAITRHGGKIWAESKPKEGAIFYFTLPLNMPSGPVTKAPASWKKQLRTILLFNKVSRK